LAVSGDDHGDGNTILRPCVALLGVPAKYSGVGSRIAPLGRTAKRVVVVQVPLPVTKSATAGYRKYITHHGVEYLEHKSVPGPPAEKKN